MSVVLPTFLYLGLCLAQSTRAQNGNLLPAVMTAQPGSMVPYNVRVTILCQGPTDAKAYEIYKVEDPKPRDGKNLLTAGNTSTLSIQEMKPDRTGLYRCSYKRGGHWSPLSDPLHLVMTGSYDKPSLSSMSGTVVAPGDNVKLQCFSRIKFEAFILIKEDAPQFTQRQSSTAQDNGHKTTFHLDRVTSTQAGTYRCYGAFNEDPYVWSHPSDPLQLEVKGSYDKPTLSSMSGTVVAPGDNVKLQCFSRIEFEAFILRKEEAPQFTQRQSSTAQDNGQQTTFHLDRVTSTQAGTYRCYGAFDTNPEVQSHPSDPLQLEVREAPLDLTTVEPKHPEEAPFDPTPVEPKHPQATDHNQTQDPQGILIGFPVAIVLLLLLFLLLFFILRHRHRKAKNNVTETKRQQATEPMNRLASEARDPQDVTYIQVAFNAPTHGTASAPSLLPRPTQASEYATVVLR